jgi:hypothetical protein
VSDTPIAERLAAELGSPWPSRWRMTGWITEGISMSKPTPEEVQQARDAAAQLANEGHDTRGIDAVIDLVTGVDGPQ